MNSFSLLDVVRARRKQHVYKKEEYKLIKTIKYQTSCQNIDNISRTHAYLEFYKMYPEMEWSLLASMVSRNTGWNMTDLKCERIYNLLSDDYLKVLYHTYERPNWLIFHDAYPQLLLYSVSLEWKRPVFHLLKAFEVSLFMEAEWELYWRTKNAKRLTYALIVNEQHVIEQPVLQHGFYASQVFDHVIFKIEEWLRLNAVVFPDLKGSLYGFSVRNFRNVNQRIELGKRLHTLLFHTPESKYILEFGLEINHTGARFDYERFHNSQSNNQKSLRDLYRVIHHRRLVTQDWFSGNVLKKWFETPEIKAYDITAWYRNKRKRMDKIGQWFSRVNTR